MIDTPLFVTLPAQQVVRIHVVTPTGEMQTAMLKAIHEITALLQAEAAKPIGPWFTHHLRRPNDTFDFFACFPVEKKLEPAGRIEVASLPSIDAVRTVYRGPYQHLPHAWQEFMDTTEIKQIAQRGDFFEVYTVNPNDNPDPASWVTELACPIASSAGATA